MPIPCYARSILFPDVRQEIVSQLKDQLKDLELQIAVDKLLHFVQYAFPYATDDEQHGFEKPYFFEELLYYPKCDCEDRSVFYAYLLREVLGVENHLIHFPGHECVAVCLGRTLHGDGYMYKGKQFYISDPTYMGASTGMCMPDYRSTNPQVEEW